MIEDYGVDNNDNDETVDNELVERSLPRRSLEDDIFKDCEEDVWGGGQVGFCCSHQLWQD